jgi:hypothetical protein
VANRCRVHRDGAPGRGGFGAGGGVCRDLPVNTETAGRQRFPKVASAPNGDFVVVWESYEGLGSSRAVIGRRFDASGSPLGPEFTVADPAGFDADVAVGAGGDFMVVWPGIGIQGRQFDASGAPRGPQFRVNTTPGVTSQPAVAAPAAGGFVVVWGSAAEPFPTPPFAIRGQRYDGAGAPQGPEFQVNTDTTRSLKYPAVSVRETGEFVVAWFDMGPMLHVAAQRFDASGAPVGGLLRVSEDELVRAMSVAHGPGGGFVVTWEDRLGIRARAFDAAGDPRGPEFLVNDGAVRTRERPDIAGDPDHGYVVVWQAIGQDGSDIGIVGRRLDATATPVGSEFVINSVTTDFQWLPSVARAPSGGFVAVWEGLQGGTGDVYAHLDCSARFHAVNPCRLADTRLPPGSPLEAGATRLFSLTGSCEIPEDARALALNITAVDPTDGGNLRLYPAGAAPPLASTMNFAPGRTRANNALVTVGTGGQVAVQCDMPPGSTGSTHLVLDVFGYFKR